MNDPILITEITQLQMSEKHKADKVNSGRPWTLRDIFGLIMFVAILVFCVKTCVRGMSRNNALEGKTKEIRAVVIDKRNYFGNSPVSQEFSYSYKFSINNKAYEGNTRDSNLLIGDSITIRYALENPEYNEPLD